MLWGYCYLTAGLLIAILLWLRSQWRQRTLLIEQRWLQQLIQQADHERTYQTDQLKTLSENKQQLTEQINELQLMLATSKENSRQQERWHVAYDKLYQEMKQLQTDHTHLLGVRKVLEVRLEESQKFMTQKQQLLEASEQRLSMQFENLANKIFTQSGRNLDEQNRLSLEKILVPLREQINGFRQQVQENFFQETQQRHTLSNEIQQVQKLNTQMARDAINLTNALKGNSKTQGNWGEIILTRVLESSGLREGHEYRIQVSVTSENSRRLQPDVIVYLPRNKTVIIDAKVSLTAYERHFNSGSEEFCQQALNEHLISIRGHIRALSQKNYHKLLENTSLDYVLMFIPIEPAFLLAIQHAPELINEALAHNILLVSPTTLLVALRTIDSLWRYERQSQHVEKIAETAAGLYDKFRLFVIEMQQVGKSLNKAQESQQNAMNKLALGRGNLIRQAEQLRTLGISVKRPLDSTLIEHSQESDNTPMSDTPALNKVNNLN